MSALKREIDHRLATHFHPAALSAQIAEVGQREGRSQAKLLLKGVAVVGAALGLNLEVAILLMNNFRQTLSYKKNISIIKHI